jgi:hypothetical protein
MESIFFYMKGKKKVRTPRKVCSTLQQIVFIMKKTPRRCTLIVATICEKKKRKSGPNHIMFHVWWWRNKPEF